ncbi:MAG TPA: Ig-like domain-containing protein [Steroidobacteraceae bacterium]|jgi:Big-like domain-containing protein|nr:Ig-like domain-containing protein [Steroidobacteraceae bacterium]
MRNLRWFTALAALVLASCGGGSDCGSSFSTNCGTVGGGPTVATVTLTSDTMSIPADGSSMANLTALAKDANNNAVSGVSITFASTAGSLVVTQAVTDASGVAKATLTASGAASGTSITVTATAGSISGNAAVTVVNTQQTITLITSLPQIPSDGSKSATLTALVRDANNNVVSGVTVSFVATSGALTITQGVTDVSGTATATLSSGTDPTNRAITVTATAGTAVATLPVNVTGTSLSLSGPANLVLNNSGSYDVLLTSASGLGIQGVAVTLTSASGNTLTPPMITTDGSGRGTVSLTASVGGADTITASALGLQQQKSVAISTQSFNITSPADGTKVNLGASQNVTVTWLNGGAPVANTAVTFAATRGTLVPSTPVMTDASGNATVAISSVSAGPSIVSASGTGVTAQITLDFVAVTPSQISVQAGPASVAVGGNSTISATVRDAANNLVEGATVDFQVQTDPTNGGLSAASAVTNSQGIAQTVYTAGNTSSGANGVTVSATVHAMAISATTSLTVGGQTVFLSMGTGNTIDTSKGVAIYQITYSVFAVDSGGAALANIPVTLSVLPVAYGKGIMTGCVGGTGTGWGPSYSTSINDPDSYNGTPMCRNEDTDYTGNINSISGKDYNGNLKLDPGNVAVVAPSSGLTDTNGKLDVTITYPRDHSYWVAVSLIASTTVQGTQSSTSSTFVLAGAVGDYMCSTGPPGPTSPYGAAATCANPN